MDLEIFIKSFLYNDWKKPLELQNRYNYQGERRPGKKKIGKIKSSKILSQKDSPFSTVWRKTKKKKREREKKRDLSKEKP